MWPIDLAIGLLALLTLWIASGRIARRLVPDEDRLTQHLAAVVASLAFLILSLQILALTGSMRRTPLLVAIGLWAVIGWRFGRSVPSQVPPTRVDDRTRWWDRRIVDLTWILCAWASIHYLMVGLLMAVKPFSDAPIYHLPFAIRWWQTGRLELVATPFGEDAATYFPANGDVWLAGLLILANGDGWVRVGQWPYLLMGASAVYALARQLGGSRSAALLASAGWIAPPLNLLQSSIPNVDLMFSSLYLTGCLFLVKAHDAAVKEEHATALIGIAGFALGIALGTRPIGLLFVPLLVLPALWIVRRSRTQVVDLSILALGLAAPSGFWFVRNGLLTGNPIYPLHVELFGFPIFSGWYTSAVMNQSGYHVPLDPIGPALLQLADRLRLVFGRFLVVVLSASVAASLVLPRRLTSIDPSRLSTRWFSILTLAHLFLFWCVVPYNTQERFLMTAVGLATVTLVPWLERGILWRAAWLVVVSAPLLAPPAPLWVRETVGISGLLPIWDRSLSLGLPLLGLALPATLGAARGIIHLGGERRRIVGITVVFLGSVLSAAPTLVALWLEPIRWQYPSAGVGAQLHPEWQRLETLSQREPRRVAYAGTNLPYYLTGLGIRNAVRYVNIQGEPDWLPHDFHLERIRAGLSSTSPDPYPEWYRREPDFEAWRRNLIANRIDMLFVARVNLFGRPVVDPGPPGFPIELEWARTHPNEFVLQRTVIEGNEIPWAYVFRFRPRVVGDR